MLPPGGDTQKLQAALYPLKEEKLIKGTNKLYFW